MGKSFDVNLRVQVHNLNEEEEEWLRDDPTGFLIETDVIDDESVSITEIR